MPVRNREAARRSLTVLTHRPWSLPLVVLMPHSRCNARCVMCDIWKSNDNRRDLTVDDVRGILDALDRWGTRRVVLSGGEALLSKNLWLFAAMLKRRDRELTLLTTGLTLAQNATEVARWCDEVVVSLDGSRAIHDEIRRVPRAFDRLAEGVAAVRREQRGVRITARCVVQRKNYFDLPNVVAAAKAIGLDGISFLPVDVSSEAFDRLPVWGADRIDETAPSLDEVDEFESIVERTILRFGDEIDDGFVIEDRTKLRRLPLYFRAVLGHGPFPPVRCNAPWVSAVIEADGAVRPCFFHPKLGNIRDRSLKDILEGTEAVDFRRRLDVAENPTCRRCVCSLYIGPRAEV